MNSGIEAVDTLVIGAGISGLTYAHARGAQTDLLVCEAGQRPGGLVWTDRESLPGASFERGPEALQSGSPAALSLLSELGLPLAPAGQAAARRYVVRDGALHAVPNGPLALLRSPLLSARGKLRLFSEPWRESTRGLDGSVAEFARHRLGREVLEALVDPVLGGIHGGDAEALSMRACFPQVVEMVEAHGSLMGAMRAKLAKRPKRPKPAGGRAARPALSRPSGGMGALTDALAANLGTRLRLATPVTRLERERQGWLAHTPAGTLRAQRVVLALSASATAELLRGCAPNIAAAAAEIVSERLVSLAACYPRDRVAHALDGFGYLVPSSERVLHLGTLFSSTIDPSICPADTVVLRVLAGGARHPELCDLSPGEIGPRLLAEVSALLGLAGEPTALHVTRWPGALPRYDLGHVARVQLIERELAQHAGLDLLGNWLHGIGLNALIAAARASAQQHAAL